MTGWILSIVGMVLTVTLTEVMLPEGQTAKYIKGIIALMVIYVVIAPIPAILQSKIDINTFFDFSGKGYESDGEFIQIVNADKQSYLSGEINEIYRKSGLKVASATIILGEDQSVSQVFLTTTSDEKQEAFSLTIEYLGIKEDRIVINEILT